jgi:hypothetical protein
MMRRRPVSLSGSIVCGELFYRKAHVLMGFFVSVWPPITFRKSE